MAIIGGTFTVLGLVDGMLHKVGVFDAHMGAGAWMGGPENGT